MKNYVQLKALDLLHSMQKLCIYVVKNKFQQVQYLIGINLRIRS